MESKIKKGRELYRVISGKDPLVVFRVMDGKIFHEGRQIDPTERARLANRAEIAITLKVTTLWGSQKQTL